LRERLVLRPPRGDTAAARVSDVLRRASRALEREPDATKALVSAMSSDDQAAIPVKYEIDTTLRAIIADAIADETRADVEFDDIVRVLGSVWFAELTYWTNGLSTNSSMGDNLSRAAELLLP
jgi:hypothetical protein